MIRIYKIDSKLKAVLFLQFHIEKCKIIEVVVPPIIACNENVLIPFRHIGINLENKIELTHLMIYPTKKQVAKEDEPSHCG